MFRSLCCRIGANLKRTTAINRQSSAAASTARYILLTFQNPDVLIQARATSMFFTSLSTGNNNNNNDVSSSSSSDSEFVISYLINSCGLSENEALSVSRKINFKTTSQPDSILSLFENYGFTKPYISKLITKRPSFLLSHPLKTLKPKLDFFISRGFHGIELADFISRNPEVLTHNLKLSLIPSFDILKCILHTDMNVVKALKVSTWILTKNVSETLMLKVEILRCNGVPETNIMQHLIIKPRSLTVDADQFNKIVDKVKEMGFDPSRPIFLVAVGVLSSMSEAIWESKLDFFRRWGWSEYHIQTAFKKYPCYMLVSENKATKVMDFLVNDMGYDSLSIARGPLVLNSSLKGRMIPRCSVIRILVSKGLTEEKLSLWSLSALTDKTFLDKFVKPYLQEAPELMTVFQGQLNDQEGLLK